MNKNTKLRNQEMFSRRLIKSPDDQDYVSFCHATADDLEWLKENDFLDPEETQNESPTAQEFLNFLKANPKFLAHGYLIGGTRDDARVSIEGIELKQSASIISLDQFLAAFELCRYADELDYTYENNQITSFRAWWD